MESYNELNKQAIITGWDRYQKIEECEYREDQYTGEVKRSNYTEEREREYCKLLYELHNQIQPFEEDIRHDYETNKNEIIFDMGWNKEHLFLWAAHCILEEYEEKKYNIVDILRLPLGIEDITIPIEHYGNFLYLFHYNEERAKLFLKDLYTLKNKKKVDQYDVVSVYLKYKGKIGEKNVVMYLFQVIGNKSIVNGKTIGEKGLGIYQMSYQSLTAAFPNKPNKN